MSYVEAEFTILIHDLLSFFLSSLVVHLNGCVRRQQTPGLLTNSAGEKPVEKYLLLCVILWYNKTILHLFVPVMVP